MSPILPLLLCLLIELPASPDVPPIPVTGAVVDEAGRPVPDAEIWLTRATRGEDDRRSGMELYWSARTGESREAPLALLTRTDAGGPFPARGSGHDRRSTGPCRAGRLGSA